MTKQLDGPHLRQNWLTKTGKILDSTSQIVGRIKDWVNNLTQDVLVKARENGKLLGNLAFLCVLVSTPMISDAAISHQIYSDFEKYSAPVDPLKMGDFAEDISKYTPGVNEKSSDVAASIVTKGDSYTLDQQLAVNANKDIGGPARDLATHTVQKGETVTQIAERFNLHVGSILDSNDIRAEDLNSIKYGTVLKIPNEDTITSADWLVALNRAEEARRKAEEQARQQKLSQQQLAAATRSRSRGTTYTTATYSGSRSINGVRYIRPAASYEYQCYGYVVSQGYNVAGHVLARWIPTNSSSPRAGGLVVTSESWAGHVAIVTSVNGDGTFNIRESNYIHGAITERTLSAGDGRIIGFVN